ncbi:hypothetical protein LEP1GSC125_2304 [Leptospira mayottensis 200901122]|uniref:Uncharacterized protein n=1 Tax=Leptospira mayottensis 200901122 TaxID=1193010 RepID=A0AA87MN03_9LEPT|nr:hypothetical protein LEP1GSC125_2304 [Leptospira mayottensis 200901122]
MEGEFSFVIFKVYYKIGKDNLMNVGKSNLSEFVSFKLKVFPFR